MSDENAVIVFGGLFGVAGLVIGFLLLLVFVIEPLRDRRISKGWADSHVRHGYDLREQLNDADFKWLQKWGFAWTCTKRYCWCKRSLEAAVSGVTNMEDQK
jgi:hypothetical protein